MPEGLPGGLTPETDTSFAEPSSANDSTPDSAGAPLVEAQVVGAPKVEKACVLLGPFDREADASDLIAALGASGHDAAVEARTEKQQSGFWVLIPPGTEEPDFLLANLDISGFEDVWRFTKGELAGSVSLGLYSDRESAQKRVSELAEKGFAAEIRPRFLQESVYWVKSLYFDSDTAGKAALEHLYNKHPRLNFPPPPCERIASP